VIKEKNSGHRQQKRNNYRGCDNVGLLVLFPMGTKVGEPILIGMFHISGSSGYDYQRQEERIAGFRMNQVLLDL
jgi:hypothetical protein